MTSRDRRSSFRRAVIAFGLVFCGAGCAQILGIDDVTVQSDAGSSDSDAGDALQSPDAKLPDGGWCATHAPSATMCTDFEEGDPTVAFLNGALDASVFANDESAGGAVTLAADPNGGFFAAMSTTAIDGGTESAYLQYIHSSIQPAVSHVVCSFDWRTPSTSAETSEDIAYGGASLHDVMSGGSDGFVSLTYQRLGPQMVLTYEVNGTAQFLDASVPDGGWQRYTMDFTRMDETSWKATLLEREIGTDAGDVSVAQMTASPFANPTKLYLFVGAHVLDASTKTSTAFDNVTCNVE